MDTQHLLDLRLRKHISEYRFMECQLEEMTFAMEAFADAFRDEFSVDIAAAARRQPTELKHTTVDASADADVSTETETTANEHDCEHGVDAEPVDKSGRMHDEPSRLVRRLYKKLALVLHPDKSGGYAVAFLAVEEAYRERDALKLLMIAAEAHISIEGIYTQGDDVSDSLSLIQGKISKIKSSIAWAWYDATEADRPRLRKTIVETLGRFRA